MTTAVVCIAKDEDHYINEWIQYHLAIGFDNVIVYCNDWKFDNTFGKKVIPIDWPGKAQQLIAYNDFIANNSNGIDWALVIDCDEFLCLGKHKNVNDLFYDYSDFFAVAFNWKAFGSNGEKTISNENYSVVKRFTKSQADFNMHVKIALNLKLFETSGNKQYAKFSNPHNIDIASFFPLTIDTAKTHFVNSPWNKISEKNTIPIGTPYIAHYMTKSRQEFIERRTKLRADVNKPRASEDLEQLWNEFDRNDIENFDILNTLNAHDVS